MDKNDSEEEIKQAVRQTYGDLARRYVGESATRPVQAPCCGPSQSSCCGPSQATVEEAALEHAVGETRSSCCSPPDGTTERSGAVRFYPADELSGLPDSVTGASAGCGNPIAIAELKPGEVVLDLGSGGGIDCFLAARQVGPQGRVIGLDMTPEMVKLARRNAKKIGAANVDFQYGEMEEIPLPDASVDVIISNCVINLSPDKDAVFHEAYRVLRPGGRMNVSDIVVDGQLPQPIRDNLNAWAGCIAGALDEVDYLAKIGGAGFEKVEVLSRAYVEAEIDQEDDWEDVQALLEGTGLSAHDLARTVASVKVRAYKPA